ncbi:hypothetical protein [Chryseobacterium carnipullorum]|nr:hypothetical protein [Chryseobacterium carnipullorum]
MQQFIKTGNGKLVDKYCIKAISIAVSERTQPSGGIETWILPKVNLTGKTEKNRIYSILPNGEKGQMWKL